MPTVVVEVEVDLPVGDASFGAVLHAVAVQIVPDVAVQFGAGDDGDGQVVVAGRSADAGAELRRVIAQVGMTGHADVERAAGLGLVLEETVGPGAVVVDRQRIPGGIEDAQHRIEPAADRLSVDVSDDRGAGRCDQCKQIDILIAVEPVADVGAERCGAPAVQTAVRRLADDVVGLQQARPVVDLQEANVILSVVERIARGVLNRIAAGGHERQAVVLDRQRPAQVNGHLIGLRLGDVRCADGEHVVIDRIKRIVHAVVAQQEVGRDHGRGEQVGREGQVNRVDRWRLRMRRHINDAHERAEVLQGVVGVEPAARHRDAGQSRNRIDAAENRGLDLRAGGERIGRRQQRHHTRHMRRSHRRTVEVDVIEQSVVWERGQNLRSRRAQVHRGEPVVGEAGQLIGPGGGGDGDDVVQVVAGREQGARTIVVDAVVACRGHEQNVLHRTGGDGVAQRRATRLIAPAVVRGDQVHAEVALHHRCVVDRIDGVGG